jgi:hypothetical protein
MFSVLKIFELMRKKEKQVKNKEIAEKNSLNFNFELTETGLQVVTCWITEFCFCLLVREDWNKGNKTVLTCQLTTQSTE